MPSPDPIPEADRQEQGAPVSDDRRSGRPRAPDAPEADAFEQELPLVDEDGRAGIDAERAEPVDDERLGTGPS